VWSFAYILNLIFAGGLLGDEEQATATWVSDGDGGRVKVTSRGLWNLTATGKTVKK
jgi:hypothetical protein